MKTEAHTGDREHRDLARGLNGGLSFTALVEAGAGTGKTSVLVERLLSIVRSGTSVSRIVAITFTEKAAGELRVRFRTDLERAMTAASGGERELLETALREIDRANVGTIHSFCAGLLRERPVEAGVDPDFAVADELRRSVLLDSAWDGWIRGELSDGVPPAVADARFFGVGLSRIRELAFRLVDDRDALGFLPEPVDPGDVGAFISELSRESETFRAVARESCREPADGAVAAIEDFAAAIESLELMSEDLRGPFALARVKVGPPKNKGRKKDWDDGVLDEIRVRAAALGEAQAELRARASHNIAVGLLGWLSGFLKEYARQKTTAGLLDFQDLLSKARDLLKDDQASREYFKRSYDRILVDEFQDTDPLQCEMVFFLAEREGSRASDWRSVDLVPGKLFIVGDPKQSIYRFRRADIETYELAKETIGAAGRVLSLSENFRTRPSVVDCVNSTFEGTMAPPEDGRAYQPDYEALAAHRPSDESGPGVVLLSPSTPFDRKAKAAEMREAEATAVAALISSILESGSPLVFDRNEGAWRRPQLRDIAILFHRTTGLDQYEEALNTYGIDYRIAGGKRFYVRREVSELATVLSAIEDPNDLVSVLGALRTPFLGVSDEDIVVHRHKTGGLRYLDAPGEGVASVEDAFRILRDLHNDRNSRSVAELLMRTFEDTAALELFLLKPTGEQRHANLLKVVELASALEKQEPMSFGGFVRWLRDVSSLTPEEAESPLAEEGDQFVRVMTIHKAKGLEFPITVLADLGRHSSRRDNLIIDRERGSVEYGKGSGVERLATVGFDDLSELEKLRAEAETLRLLYVGMTRARDAVIVPWFAPTGGSKGLLSYLDGLAGVATDESDSRASWLDAGKLDLSVKRARPVRLPMAAAFDIDPSTTDAARELAEWTEARTSFIDRHHRAPLVITPSSLAHTVEDARVPPARDASSHSDGAAADAAWSGAELGSLVHAVMERVAFDVPGDARDLVSAAARRTASGSDMAAKAEVMVRKALESDVLRRAADSGRAFREVPFCARRGEVTVEGKIDLVFVEDGELVVVDFKTDAEPDEGFDGLVERYRGQALGYGVAAEQATGLPLKEVVLLFLSAPRPVEKRVGTGHAREDRERELDGIIEELTRARSREEIA